MFRPAMPTVGLTRPSNLLFATACCSAVAADMKGSLAAMVVAERFVAQYPNHKGRLAFDHL
jgi:hypothetical protein